MNVYGQAATPFHLCCAVVLMSVSYASASKAQTQSADPAATPSVAQCTTISAVVTDQPVPRLPGSRGFVQKSLIDVVNECLDRVEVEGASRSTLLDLAFARHTFENRKKANDVLGGLFATAGTSDSVRAESMSRLASPYVMGSLERMRFAAKVATLIDSLPAAGLLQKMSMHQRLYQRYSMMDNDSGVLNHALAIVAHANGLKVHVRTKEAPAVPAGMAEASMLLSVYQAAGKMLGNFGEERRALDLLRTARANHPEVDVKYFDGAFHFTEQRLRLIGQPARAIPSAHWFNTTEGTKALDYAGKVTLIGFTAHWCPPCLHTYVPFQALADTLGKDGLQVMFATEYFGYVGDPYKKLVEADETIATRAYYEKNGIRFPIALLGPGLDSTFKQRTTTDSAFLFYGIEVVPLAALVDRRGIVRRIVAGWDTANPARLNVLLRSLLKEP